MPTSPTRLAEPRAGQAGLTLVEMLVVLAIMGVVSAAAVLGLGGMSHGGGAETEARLLGQRLQLAADEAMVTDRPVALTWEAHSYAFAGVPGSDDLDGKRDLRSGVTLSIPNQDAVIPIAADGTGQLVEAALDDGRARWSVRFDGVDVAVARADGG